MKLRTLLCASVLLAPPLAAGDYDALARTLRQAWPQCATVALVCDTAASKAAIDTITGALSGLKVIVAEGECQLERQRRLKPINAQKLKNGERVVRVRYGVDEDTCTGDHSCIRLSGCPSLTIKDSSDPLRVDPVAHVNNNCVGCGLCGEVSHAATLCPSFYRAEIVHNPTWWDRLKAGVRGAVIRVFQPA